MKCFSQIIFVSTLLLISTSCSDDDDNGNTNPTPSGHGGSATFVIDGALSGEMTGVADFKPFEMSGIHTWNINILDQGPVSYTISIGQTGSEPIARPEPGTYTLGIDNPINPSGDIYTTSYAHYGESQATQDSYAVGLDNTSGVMVITTSTDNLIEGTFEFSAARFDDDGNIQTINVAEGEFSAVPRQ